MAIDHTSRLLGELVASVKSLTSQTKDQRDDIKELKSVMRDVAALSEKVDKIVPHVEDYKRMKQRGLTVIVMIGFLGGGLGVIGTMLGKVFFGNGGG